LIEIGTLTISRRVDQQPEDIEPLVLANELHAKGVVAWALFSSALFALYPLHAEPVSWITGRVDPIVTMFYLLSFFCYLRWRQAVGNAWLVASLAAFTASLLSKEMAVTLPAFLFVVEMLYPSKPKVKRKSLPALALFVIGKALEKTLIFWLTLILYFLIRRIALGTFIGGYNALDGLPSLHTLTQNWIQAGSLMLLPINHDLLSNQAPFMVGWLVCFSAAIAFTLYVLVTNPQVARVFVLLLSWFVLSLLPVLSVLIIAQDLEGSRLVYLATAAMSSLICLSSLQNRAGGNVWVEVFQRSNRIGLFALLCMSLIVLYTNNQAWHEAGKQTRSIVDGLKTISLERKATSASTYLVGLPDNIHGAYVARNALDGMTKPPVMASNLNNYFSLDNFDRVFPFGFARQSIASPASNPKGKAAVYLWNQNNRLFTKFDLDAAKEQTAPSWQGEDLVHYFELGQSVGQIQADGDRGIDVTGDPKKRSTLVFSIDDLPCWTTEMLVLTVKTGKALLNNNQNFFFNYTNDQVEALDPRYRVPPLIVKSDDHYKIVFPLHSEVSWAFGKHSKTLVFSGPEGFNFTIESISVAKASEFLPTVSIKPTGNQNENGFIQLNNASPDCQLNFDVSEEDEATGVALEVARASQFFQLHNSTTSEPKPLFTGAFNDQTGTICLNRDDFPGEGLYEARVIGIDGEGRRVGFASDHVLVTVN
jgi:hypothetical protein